jgi:NAD(P)-dependent dehydrogenase (short-subunit alcohol dehydrogenase family)
LIRALAVEYAMRGVTFNAVGPDYTDTAGDLGVGRRSHGGLAMQAMIENGR